MNVRKLQKADVETLLEWYADAAAAQGRAMDVYDFRAANPQADLAFAIYREIRARGSEAQQALLTLLKHPDPHVRHWAAGDALEFAPEEAEATLTELVESASPPSKMTFERTLRAWHNGTLRFP